MTKYCPHGMLWTLWYNSHTYGPTQSHRRQTHGPLQFAYHVDNIASCRDVLRRTLNHNFQPPSQARSQKIIFGRAVFFSPITHTKQARVNYWKTQIHYRYCALVFYPSYVTWYVSAITIHSYIRIICSVHDKKRSILCILILFPKRF